MTRVNRSPRSKRELSQGLNSERRLRHRSEFKRFFQGAQVFRFPECVLFRIENQSGHFRLGVTFKAKGSSIQRNKVKRQVREAFRRAASSLGSFDYNVVIPRHASLDHPYPVRLGESLRKGLRRVVRKDEV